MLSDSILREVSLYTSKDSNGPQPSFEGPQGSQVLITRIVESIWSDY